MIGAAGLALAAALAAVAALWPARGPESSERARADGPGTPALTVSDIQLGRAVGLDKRISDPADAFSADETIYVSVATVGAGHARLTARWMQGGRLLAEVSQGIEPGGAAVSEFNAWKPSGWPRGEYEVQILVDGVPAGARRFPVR